MPPSQYLPLHPDARLSDEEEQILIDALETKEEGGEDHSGRGREGDDDEGDDGGGDEDRSGTNSGPG